MKFFTSNKKISNLFFDILKYVSRSISSIIYNNLIIYSCINYESIFQDQVINDFADSYLRGETPIPCVRCNQSVKFQDLLKFAKDLKADALATGHYVQKFTNNNISELHKGFSEENLGELFSYFMLEVIIIGMLNNVNPFNQKAVEEIKIKTRNLLL